MTLFRPCIDLHEGRVKQIVGGSLREGAAPATNFVSDKGATYYADLYRQNDLRGGHIIMLGGGNEDAAKGALAAWPGGMQVGGGISPVNAKSWLDAGASHVIVTSWLFPAGDLSMERLRELSALVDPNRLVIDLSCRRVGKGWNVAIDRWQTITPVVLDEKLFEALDPFCAEYLVHAADVEGLRAGLDWDLVRHLSGITTKPMTYAGGASSISDLERMETDSAGKVDLTIGSALDIFGGTEVRLDDCVAFNRRTKNSL
ncbi:MAG TPA: phosphoribosylformimino-5-aminoimidazole carboxamide ribotide isomerase [Fibrobacteria bacterium]|jgi:phosphoribosylformimino-5-aminoimidazole carboxamide ribotide isomerase|nr:phosphoribosylformimino-5-aminoimidazole carboxamide ribotide isomerase [Fibrobacteria bacterium]